MRAIHIIKCDHRLGAGAYGGCTSPPSQEQKAYTPHITPAEFTTTASSSIKVKPVSPVLRSSSICHEKWENKALLSAPLSPSGPHYVFGDTYGNP